MGMIPCRFWKTPKEGKSASGASNETMRLYVFLMEQWGVGTSGTRKSPWGMG